jgi:O-antigen ligase
LGELIDYIPRLHLQRIALILILIWCVSPIIALAYNVISYLPNDVDWVSQLHQMNTMTINWYKLLLQVGFLGCLIGIVSFAKNIREAKASNINKKDFIKNRIIAFCLLLMLFWSLLSYFASGNMAEALVGQDYGKVGILTYFAAAGVFCSAYAVRDKKYISWIMELYVTVAIIQSLLVLTNAGDNIKPLVLTNNSGAYFNINHFAYYLCMAVMCSLLLYVTESRSKKLSLGRLFIFAILVAALVRNHSLGPYLAVLCAFISSIVLAIWLDRRQLKRIITAFIIFVLVTIIMSISDGYLYLDLRIFGLDLLRLFEGQEEINDIGSGRWILWVNGMDFIKERPLLGSGPSLLYDKYLLATGSINRPHNEFIEHAASIGIPGVLLYISTLFLYLKSFIKKRKNVSILGFGLLSIIIAYLVSSLFGVTMYNVIPFFFMFFGISIGQLQEISNIKPEDATNDISEDLQLVVATKDILENKYFTLTIVSACDNIF